MPNKSSRFLALASLMLASFITSAAPATYTVIIEKDDQRYAKVLATLAPGPHGLCMTRGAGDSGLTHGWATFMHELNVLDEGGADIEVDYDGKGCWRFAANRPVTAEYIMLLRHDQFPNDPGDDELAYKNDTAQFWTGRALFLEGAEPESIQVEFKVPDGWRVTAPWPTTNDAGTAFAPHSNTHLLENGFMLGTHSVETINLGDATVYLGLAGEGPEERQSAISEMLRGALNRFSDLYQSAPEGEFAVFMGQGRLLGGGVVGQTVSMLVKDGIPDELLPLMFYIVTHEAFHLWNADLEYDPVENLYWFSEGSAEYYSFLALNDQGVWSAEATLAQLAERAGMYEEALGDLSMVAAGTDKLNHYNLIYSGGLFAVMALDMRIVSETNGQARFAAVLPALFKNYRKGSPKGLTLDRLVALIQKQTGVDTSDIVSDSINGTKLLPAAELIEALIELTLALAKTP